MQDFKQLKIWQLGREFTKQIYEVTKGFPANEQYAMVSQIRRASCSICANISEGSAKGNKDFARYLLISQGSIKEIENFLILARDLEYLTEDKEKELQEKLEVIAKMNHNLIKKLGDDIK